MTSKQFKLYLNISVLLPCLDTFLMVQVGRISSIITECIFLLVIIEINSYLPY